MKRSVAISFLFLHLVFSTEMHEFLKMPVFVFHYIEHQKDSKDHLSLFSFIKLHYFSHDRNDQDHEDHEELPFHDHSILCNSLVMSLLPTQFVSITGYPSFRKQIPHSSNDNSPLNFFHSDIWQPPRLA